MIGTQRYKINIRLEQKYSNGKIRFFKKRGGLLALLLKSNCDLRSVNDVFGSVQWKHEKREKGTFKGSEALGIKSNFISNSLLTNNINSEYIFGCIF